MLYGLVDCNNFYCSCERVFHPDLYGRPVVVLSNNDGCVIARSEESKALGVKMGAPFYQVKDLLERQGVAVFSSNYNLYGDMSRRVMGLLARFAPRIEVYSIDEAFVDLTGIPDVVERGMAVVAGIRKGTGIPVSMGVAPTRTLAKMASKFAKKYPGYRGVCNIDTDERREAALRLFDIGDVWGIGRRHASKLKGLGVNTAYDFTQRPADWVRSRFAVTGLRTWKELRGEDCVSIDELPHKQSICTSRSFADCGIDRLADVEEAVANHAAQCCRKLREQGTACASLTVFAHTSMFNEHVPSDYIQADWHFDVATSSLSEIVEAAVGVLRRGWKADGVYRYKRAGVIVWNITPSYSVQGSLFDTVDRGKQERLMQSIDKINHTYGHAQVRVAVQGYSKRWHLKTEHLSRQYTTDISQSILLHAR